MKVSLQSVGRRRQPHLKGAGPKLPLPAGEAGCTQRHPERSMTWRVKGLGPCADPRKSGSHQTPCWRKADSNSRSHLTRQC